MTLFQRKNFIGHSGQPLTWKLECDALTTDDWECLAHIVAEHIQFSSLYGVPRGGIPFSNALSKYIGSTGPLLIVDDVFTTGTSMEEAKLLFPDKEVRGVVVFARSPCPSWITPLFQFGLSKRFKLEMRVAGLVT